jgi:hypothetical protein
MIGQRKGRKGRRAARPKCRTITFKREKRGGKILPRSQWRTVERCEGRSAKGKWKRAASKRVQCRKGGMGVDWAQFAKCPRDPRKLHSYAGEKIYLRPTR